MKALECSPQHPSDLSELSLKVVTQSMDTSFQGVYVPLFYVFFNLIFGPYVNPFIDYGFCWHVVIYEECEKF